MQLPPPGLSSFIPFRKQSSTPYGPPQPAPGGIVGWFNDRIRAFQNRGNRTAAGAYEEPLQGGPGRGGRRGFGPLDPDEAWDSRVGNEADAYGAGGYYEEQELGIAPRHGGAGGGGGTSHLGDDTSYGGGSYAMNLAATPREAPEEYGEEGDAARGRTASRQGLAVPGAGQGKNPFDDDADPSNVSLRGVSPRPIDTNAPAGQQAKDADSPTSRKSVFRENM
jgi:hypothetical protein